MLQSRLNHVVICHVHRHMFAQLEPQVIADVFVQNCLKRRQNVFGRFKEMKLEVGKVCEPQHVALMNG